MTYLHTLARCVQIARALGTSPMLFFTLVSILARKKMSGPSVTLLSLRYRAHPFSIGVRDAADLAALYEVFIEHEYEFDAPEPPKIIVDLGGHIGTTALYFALRYPGAHMYVYEADPDNFALLTQNTAAIPTIRCIHAAVAAADGSRTFFKGSSSISSSLIERPGSEGFSVTTHALDTIINTHRPDLIKFDIEGAEGEVFAAAAHIGTCPRYIGELHYDLMGKTYEEFVKYFAGYSPQVRQLSPMRAIALFTRS